jgi:phenylalanyl-tRNA synthetase alpha chain
MVHPKVLENVGINSNKYQGYAFGMGLDRLLMLKYNVPDVRMLYTGDLRFVNQF